MAAGGTTTHLLSPTHSLITSLALARRLKSSSFASLALKLPHLSLSSPATFASGSRPLSIVAASKKAVAVLKGSSAVEGVVTLTQDDDGPTTVKVKVTGLTPGLHGFHLMFTARIWGYNEWLHVFRL